MLVNRKRWRSLVCLVTWGILSCWCDTSRADPILSFSPSIDVNQAIMGRTFSVDIVLSGLNPGDKLTFLGFDATVDAASFSLPNNLRAGGIIPDIRSFSPLSFNFGNENFSTASFESQIGPMPPYPLPPIGSNGVFMSFDITPTRTGISSLNFVFVGSAGKNSVDIDLPNARGGPALQFNVSAVPEPSLWGALLAGCGLLCSRRRRSRALPRAVNTH